MATAAAMFADERDGMEIDQLDRPGGGRARGDGGAARSRRTALRSAASSTIGPPSGRRPSAAVTRRSPVAGCASATSARSTPRRWSRCRLVVPGRVRDRGRTRLAVPTLELTVHLRGRLPLPARLGARSLPDAARPPGLHRGGRRDLLARRRAARPVAPARARRLAGPALRCRDAALPPPAMTRPQATPRAIAVARGDEPADLLITGGRVFVPATREWVDTALAIADGVVAGWGEREAREIVDVGGARSRPGSSTPTCTSSRRSCGSTSSSAAVLPHGTTAVAADPHEIANVFGVAGRRRAGGGRGAAAVHLRRRARRAACRRRRSRASGAALDARRRPRADRGARRASAWPRS